MSDMGDAAYAAKGSAVEQLEALVKRLEAAVGGTAELDAEIAIFILGRGKIVGKRFDVVSTTGLTIDERKYYTTSIDAALTLVPEGFAVEDMMIWPGHPSRLSITGTHKEKDGQYWHSSEDGRWSGTGSTAPLAICLAALRARLAKPLQAPSGAPTPPQANNEGRDK